MATRIPRLQLSRHGVFCFRYIRPPKPPLFTTRREICISLRTRNSAEARIIALFLNQVIESKLANEIDKKLLQNLATYASPYTLKIGRLTAEIKNDQDRELIEKDLKNPQSELGKLMREAANQEPALGYDVKTILQTFDAEHYAKPSGATQGIPHLNVRKTFAQAIEQFLDSLPATGNSVSTIKNKQTKLHEFYNWLTSTKKLIPPGYPNEVHAVYISEWINHYSATGAKGRRVGAKTMAGLFTVLNDFFEHCVTTQLCHTNPAAGFTATRTRLIRQAKQELRSYETFRPEDVERIFQPDLYFACMSQADIFFGPLIAIFSGARREEIAALKESDFIQEQVSANRKIWAFKIKTRVQDGRSIKNQNSERIVPVCDALIEAGLIDYLLHIRALKKPGERPLDLFPARKAAKKGNKLGEKFSWYLKTVGVKFDQGTQCFHSLRHTVITALSALQVPPQASMTIVGHLAQTELEKYGWGRRDATVSGSDHLKTYDASAELGYSTSHPRERSKKILDRLNTEFKIDTAALGKHAKEVIRLTRRLAKGEFESGQRAPDYDSLCKQFPDHALTRVERVRYSRKIPTPSS